MKKKITPNIGLPTHRCPTSPGEMLREEFLGPLDLSQSDLAARMNVPVGRINQILKEKRAVTADTAVRLNLVLGMSAEFWLGLQNDWDLWHAQKSVDVHELDPVERVAS